MVSKGLVNIPELTEPSSPSTTGPLKVGRGQRQPRVNPSALEREAQELCGPETFASEWFWDQLAVNAGLYWVLQPLRLRVQRLAGKFRHDPKVFWEKFERIRNQRIKSLIATPEGERDWVAFLYFCRQLDKHHEPMGELSPGTRPFTFTEGLSVRRLNAVKFLIPWWRGILRGRNVKVRRQELRERLFSFFSFKRGDDGDTVTRTIRRIDSQARAQNRHLTDGDIARRVFKWYPKAEGWRKADARQKVKDARRVRR